ncbi:MAG: carbohydrate-binding family 9-like protein [Chthoniobacter sp.]|uniref:carbohydrate-binding family 9-like protein n=1 Tax=Chthoniobacter sp. TaxID=2510640 RepID=UPI0032ADD7A0
MLSTMRCERRVLGEITADPLAALWLGVDACEFRLAIDGRLPLQSTTVRSLWNADEWRILFEVADTHVWATHTERGAPLYQEEVVEVFIDPVGDLESYFEIELNPLNTVMEVVLRRNRSGYLKDFAWRCEGLRTAARRTDTGWCAELAIPFRSLTADPPSVGEKWRANFCRIDRPPGVERELTAWSSPGRANFHTPERFGFVDFVA